MAFDAIPTEIVFNNDELDIVPSDTLVLTVGGVTSLIIADLNGLHRYRVEDDGSLTLTDSIAGSAYGMVPILQDDGSYVIQYLGDGFIAPVKLGLDESFGQIGPSVDDNEYLSLDGAETIVGFEISDVLYIAVASVIEDGVTVFQSDGFAKLSATDALFDGDLKDALLNGVDSLAVFTDEKGGTNLYAGARVEDGINRLGVDKDGKLSWVSGVSNSVDLKLNEVRDVETVVVGGNAYLLATALRDGTISVFGLDGSGAISKGPVDTLSDGEDGVSLPGIDGIATTVMGGQTYIIVSYSGPVSLPSKTTESVTGGFSILAIDENGQLTPVLSRDTNLSGNNALAFSPLVTVIDGVTYLTVPGDEDNSLFLLMNNLIDETAMTVQVAENTTPVTSVPKLFAEDAVTYSLGGADAALFTIDTDGNVSFINAPDYENPADVGGDNIYDVEVIASEGSDSETKMLTVEVTNVSGPDIVGTKKKDKLNGTGEDETILGKNGKDNLKGFAGGDLLDGGKKKDKLTGGEDADQFRFSTKLKDKWADKIKDFEVGEDTILLDAGIFKKLGGPGALDSDAFAKGKIAKSGDDRILHHKKSGNLLYDKDGKGGKDAVKFAKVDKGLNLSADDFLVI